MSENKKRIKELNDDIKSCENYLANYKDFATMLELSMKNFGIMPNDVEIMSNYINQRITDGDKALADYHSEIKHHEREIEKAEKAKAIIENLDAELGDTVTAIEDKVVEEMKPFLNGSDDDEFLKVVRYHVARTTNDELKVGDIMYSSWGYDQTNIDFYEVVGFTKSRKSVKIRPIAKRSIGDGEFMSMSNMPDPGNYVGDPMTKRIKNYGDWSVTLSSYSSAWMWNGSKKNSTHYA